MKVTSKSNHLVFSGRLGPTVNYQWRGRWCARSLPSHYNDARSEAQLTQRSIFKQTVAFASKARRALKLGLRTVSQNAQMTESNYFMRLNRRCFSLVEGVLAVDYGSLLLSDGPVAPVAFDAPQMIDESTLAVDFEKNPLHRSTKSDDLVYLVAYCPEHDAFDVSEPVYRRRSHLEMSLNEGWIGHEVHLWGFVVDNAGRASMSQYIGSGTLDATVGNGDEPDSAIVDDINSRPSINNIESQTVTARSTSSSVTTPQIGGSASMASPPE